MKAIRFSAYGGPEVLTLEEVPMPTPGPGEVRVRVEAAGVNYADTMQRRDVYPAPTLLPFAPGGEIAGTVDARGGGVESPVLGTRVMALLADGGGYAEYAVVPAAQAISLPPGFDPVQAPALLVQGLTAYLTLTAAGRLQPGERVLVHAAAGGVGSLAVQLAKLLGAGQVIATASTDAKLALARSLGADVGVDYTQPGWADRVRDATGGTGVDLVLDSVGGDVFHESFACLATFGRVITFGNASGTPSILSVGDLLLPNHTVTGFYLGPFFGRPALIAEAFAALFGFIADGRLRIEATEQFPLAQAAEAHRRIEARQTTGKVVLRP